jgi:hypothetical protein
MMKRKEVNGEYMEAHHCKARKKGRNRGRWCRYLYPMEEADKILTETRELDKKLRSRNCPSIIRVVKLQK